MAIIKGDEYKIPIVIKEGDTVITEELVNGVRVGLGTVVSTYPDGTLTYKDGLWYFPLTQEISYRLQAGSVPFQVQIKVGDQIFGSPEQQISIQDCIIKGVWE